MAELVLTDSAPLDMGAWSSDDHQRWSALPDSYQAFLLRTNGGFVEGMAWYPTPIATVFNGERTETNSGIIDEFWSFQAWDQPVERRGAPTSLVHEYFEQHQSAGFLPEGVFAIASSLSNELTCISLRPDTYGEVFYFEPLWRYPRFIDFFRARIEATRLRYPDAAFLAQNPSHPRHQEVMDAMNFATLVKVASSFEEFLRQLKVDPDE